ncbi:uncharacterized protein LOC122651451 [Telopea speciosissima]|uniref:uncharacterized protein LOC122651451 n=1 Tax=Telopea speciosissima TaxID=54955 RepID=UPI001CC72AA1|nr:uncharacterized protein LOC122651451 [Telopea speciosissima]XP_043700771.1 uncharacterized protein LOC122651451 [Telopea speciosissima]XP_043700772.1 uncharacterized protein LOC122651451 [Telopea speciosissima]
MAIVKNNFRVSKLDGEFSPVSRDSMSTDEDELRKRSSTSESDNDDDEDEDGVDSGAGSDDFDMSELGEIGEESCQLGGGNCSIPYELYDLPDLGEILTLDAWNNCLTEEDRFSLAEYLPDMDQETFMRTLKELFSGNNFHFGSPVAMLFDMLKEGLCEPRVTLYRQGLNFFQKREHYHLLRKYQNSMVGNLIQIKDAWENCAGYSIEERLRVLNIMRSQRSLMYEKMEARGLETDTSDRDESGEGFWGKRLKDMKLKPKIGRRDIYSVSPTLNNSSRGRPVPLEPVKYGKSNPKGILKFAGSKALSEKGFVGRFPSSIQPGLKSKSRAYRPTLALPRQDQVSGYDSDSAPRSRGQIRGEEDAEGPPYEMDHLRDRTHGTTISKVGSFKPGKKSKLFKTEDEYAAESLMGLPLAIPNDLHSHGRGRSFNQMAELETLKAKPSGEKSSYNYYSRVAGTKAKHSQKVQKSATKDQMKATKDQSQHLLRRGNQADWSVGRESIQRNKVKEEAFDVDYPVKHDEWSVKGKRWKMGKEFQTGKNSVGLDRKVKSHRTFPTQMDDMVFRSDYRTKASLDKVKKKSSLNGGLNMEELRSTNMYARSEETESDSSEQVSEEEFNPLRNKPGPRDVEGHRSTSTKAIADPKKGIKLGRKDREYAEALEQLRMADVDVYPSKGKQKGKIRNSSYMHTNVTGISEESGYAGFAKTDDDGKKAYKLGKNGHVQGEPGERLHLPSLKAYPPERKHKGKVDHDYSVPRSNYMHDYINEEKNNLHLKQRLVSDHGLTNKLGKKGQNSKAHLSDRHERSNLSLLGCNSKKRKGKTDVKYMDGPNESDQMQSSPQQQVEDPTSLKKRGKRKVEAETDSLAIQNSEPLVSERGAMDVEADVKPPKKPFTLITPTVHTGFSFSIIHLLSAVRMAMITRNAEDSSELDNHLSRTDGRRKSNNEEQSRKHERTNVDTNNSELVVQKTLPSLTVQEIVNRVRSNPGDPCILETQEPLQDLVRGVLKVFSSKTAPLGAKGWKPLVCYEKSTKSWSWIGPHTDSSSDLEAAEEETSSEAWALPHKMLVKLVDSFANWLKSGQETLQQIGSLPAPPVTLMQPNLDEKERFRDLRAQKSLTTISPSSEEVRAYFRKEELLRYSVPDRAFSYTAADGRKSIVAPLRRCGGKPTSKARDHFMLKPDRPPHVTILCLVRDAAARLPGSIGTRADVCTLIRDSQYIVENVSDAQINQVVSGALDRLHYERDPCVQFDGDRKLWVYLHREREEEDFEDDGTSSTKKWKRQRKDGTEQLDPGPLNISYHGSGEPIAGGPGYDLGSDLNVEPAPIHEGRRTELGYNDDSKQKIEDNVESYAGSGQGGMHLGWEARENKMLCQENSTNEDFDDETFSRERPFGLLSAGLS